SDTERSFLPGCFVGLSWRSLGRSFRQVRTVDFIACETCWDKGTTENCSGLVSSDLISLVLCC
ncbi:hypothetical protein CHARACLAT_024109, partial [Characodon lateralis]|nr:hypothetical protein [Characodon lateralis]